MLLLLGLVSVAAGIIAIVDPRVTIFVLVLLMGANALFTGVLDIILAIRLRKQIEGEWLLALSGAISIVFGMVVIVFPPAGALAIAFLVGLYATVIGILLLVLAFRVRQRAKHLGGLSDGSKYSPRRVTLLPVPCSSASEMRLDVCRGVSIRNRKGEADD
jgi:hypothetical protein